MNSMRAEPPYKYRYILERGHANTSACANVTGTLAAESTPTAAAACPLSICWYVTVHTMHPAEL